MPKVDTIIDYAFGALLIFNLLIGSVIVVCFLGYLVDAFGGRWGNGMIDGGEG